ncbi:MAG: nucleotide exchange factor GrpE [Candidatus Helarchaeota archaeon]|nr:nucleotide exchange factor GrpE [Candidatus Helarchaeota archaeon]
MKEEKSPAATKNSKKNPESDKNEEVDVSFDEIVPASIPDEWKGKPEAEISLLLELQQLKKKMECSEKEWFDKYARLQAEFENFRRRSLKEKDEYIKYASSQIILKLLTTLDNFEVMLKNLEPKLKSNDFKGIQMIYKELYGMLEKEGLTPIKAKGEKFNPFVHEILTVDNTDSCPEDTITEEFQKGYKFKDQVLRTSKVKIAKCKKPEPGKVESNPEEEEHKTD